MLRVSPTKQARTLFRRLCPKCGFDGRQANALPGPQRPFRCPNCGLDWRRRPPMSYAEMEGIVPEPEQVLFELERDELTRTRRIELGLALGFGSLVGGVLVLHVGYVLWTTMQ